MEQHQQLINIWNGEFPNYPLTIPDLKKPHAMLQACLHMFQHLGLDNEAILSTPPEGERDENMIYYWDLLPIINVTRVINHIIDVLHHSDKLSIKFPLPMTFFLQPDAGDSHSILLLLVNLVAFNENKLKQISPQVAELFGKRDQVKALNDKKKSLLGAINKQVEEKADRADRLQRLDTDIQQFGEELQKEKEAHAEEQQELEACLKEKQQLEILLDQKKTQRDALIAEVNRRKALRVYDVEDILAQSEQAAQNVREAEEKLESLKATLMQKENCLKNLQKLKPNLDVANNLLSEITSLSEDLRNAHNKMLSSPERARAEEKLESLKATLMQKENCLKYLQKLKPNLDVANNLLSEITSLSEDLSSFAKGTHETDSTEDELDLMHTELTRVQIQLAELQSARAEFNEKRAEAHARRHLHKAQVQSALREAEEKDRKCLEKSKKSLQEIEEIKEVTVKCEHDRAMGFEELERIKTDVQFELGTFNEALLKKVAQAESNLEERLGKRRR